LSSVIYSRDLANIIKALKSIDKRLARIDSKLDQIAPPDVDPFDPEDGDDVTEDDLPFM
jgi:hypothetical protein